MKVLLVSLTNDVGTDRIVSEIGQAGGLCAVVSPPGSFAALATCVVARFELPKHAVRAPFALRRTLQRAVETWQPDRIVPLDDLAAVLLRALRPESVSTALYALVTRSLGTPAHYAAAAGRVALMRVASQNGVRIPGFVAAGDSLQDVHARSDVGFPVMVKRDQSSGSGGVTRVVCAAALPAVLRRARWKTFFKSAFATLAGFRRAATPALIQEEIVGQLAMFTAVCHDGTLIDGIGFTAVKSHPVKRSSTILRLFPHAEMEKSARTMAAALRCSGFISFDFIVDAAGAAHLIEMNPRPIGSVHLGRLFGHDLARAFLTSQRDLTARCDLAPNTEIALFPKELERDPSGRYLAEARPLLHDIPLHEPAVVAAYMRHLALEDPVHANELPPVIARHVADILAEVEGLGAAEAA